LRVRADPRGKFRPLPVEAETLLNEGRLVDAIKSLRQSHGLGRRDAEEWIDAYVADNPLLRVQLETQRREARRKFFVWFVIIDVIITAGVIYWLFYRPV
jgi:hypothetical protein